MSGKTFDHHHHFSCLSSWRIGSLTSLLQSFIPSGKTYPLPLSLYSFPSCLSGGQVSAMCGFCWWSIHNTCPIRHHVYLLVFLLMVQVPTLHLASLLVTVISQYIFNTLHRCLWRNMSSFASSFLVISQVLHP